MAADRVACDQPVRGFYMHHRDNTSGIIEEPREAWQKCEDELDAHGTPLPLFHRVAWARALKGSASCSFIPVRAADGSCRAGIAFETHRTRALPGHNVVSIHRLGIGIGGLDESSIDAALATLTSRLRRSGTTLRATVATFGLEQRSLRQTGAALRRAGFEQVPAVRTYERTLVVDLAPDEDAIFAGFHKNARQGVRNIARYPVQLSTAVSPSVSEQLQVLSDQTRGRTGGEKRDLDWRALIRMSAEAPHLSRIAILKRTDVPESENIIAFAWGCMHGGVAEYSESGSKRMDEWKVSTSYALLWDLMRWSKANGARWFDMGGITAGTTNSNDPLGGISDFKRRFSQHELEVGQQWEMVPHPARAAAARIVSSSADVIRRGTRWLRR